MLKIMQIGLGPLGIKIASFIAERNGLYTISAVDKNHELVGKNLGTLAGFSTEVSISPTIKDALKNGKPDVAVLTTVSDMKRITPQIEEILDYGVPVISTCEELSFPWNTSPELANLIDKKAKKAGVAVLGTGVNPGFLMDTLPTFLTGVCQEVTSIKVRRFQNAQFRRIPFQKKIGAGLSPEQFEERRMDGSLRHVGLTESMHFIANRMGWKLDKTEDVISPVIAKAEINTEAMTIPVGFATGVRQIGNAYVNGDLKIELEFQATVGEPESFDEVIVNGSPSIRSKINGGVNGDIATCAITLNAIPQLLRSRPGLMTMADIPPVSWF